MSVQQINKKTPDTLDVVVEIAANSAPNIKYELDKKSNLLRVDRFVATPMYYPCNYGFIPQTLADDGDPLDALVITECPLVIGTIISCKPIGVLLMEDEKGLDEKIIAVPTEKLNSEYSHLNSLEELPEGLKNKIQHFFEHYKDLEKGKWVKVTGFRGVTEAHKKILTAMKNSSPVKSEPHK
jgi:inorganic pyrophosphatase